MSKLSVDQKTIKELFENKKSDFLIPDYQRPYAWEADDECSVLWEDIFTFAFPDNNCDNFDSNNEYFLGPIVTFKNEQDKMEVIDGQQRLTTLLLLLRAFCAKLINMQDAPSKTTREDIERCIWKTDEFGTPIGDALKINSEVATDNDKEEFLEILRTGIATEEQKSNYALNYKFFQQKINDFVDDFPSYFPHFPMRILKNCIFLPIEAGSQDTALRIFSTLNDRGKPLADADIFKAELYKFYSKKGEKEQFIEKWRKLEALCREMFSPASEKPMDELFTQYMYYERAKAGTKSSTTEALRKFYEKNSYNLLKQESTFENLIKLADFWNDVLNQNSERFSIRVLRRLFVLSYAPNGMWTYFVSVYFMQNKDADVLLNDEKFFDFLTKITAFIWAYTITNPGVNALRTPVFAEMLNIVDGKSIDFLGFKFDLDSVENAFYSFSFKNGRPITKSMLAWWAFNDDNQNLLSLETKIEIEHIFARNRQYNEKLLKKLENLENLGNKALLEKRINIRASDYRFSDKKKYYEGHKKEGTRIYELLDMAKTKNDFDENDIEKRNKEIIGGFMNFLRDNRLVQQEMGQAAV